MTCAVSQTSYTSSRAERRVALERINTTTSADSTRGRVSLGGVPMVMTPAEFAKFIAAETAKWAEVVKKAGIRAN